MASTVNAALLDHAIHHAIDLTRYSNTVVRRMIALLNRSDPDLVAQISAAMERMPEGSFTVGHLEQVLGSVRQINTAAYAQVFQGLAREMHDMTDYEVGYQTSLLDHVIPAPVLVRFPLAQVSASQVYAAALARPFQGGLLSDWAKSVDANRMKAVREAIRQGFVQGKTTDQIVTAIRGTRALGYSDGVLEGSRKGLAAIVRTALSHTASVARQETYKANGDIIGALQWVSVLDNRTTSMCMIRDGLTYSADPAHKPIGHMVPWLQGPGALHFCCRSSDIPVTKSWKDLGLDVADLPDGTRASMDGQVPASTTYARQAVGGPAGRHPRRHARQADAIGRHEAAPNVHQPGRLPDPRPAAGAGRYRVCKGGRITPR